MESISARNGAYPPDPAAFAAGGSEVETPALVPPQPDRSACDLLFEAVRERPEIPVYAVEGENGEVENITATMFYGDVVAVAKGFIACGVEPGEFIAVACRPCYEWPVMEFAAWLAGARLLGVHENSSVAQIRWILSDSAARIAIVDDEEQAGRFQAADEEQAGLDHLWQLSKDILLQLAERGAEVSDEELRSRYQHLRSSDLATVVYTAEGAAGRRPLGALITHGNIYENVRATRHALRDILLRPVGDDGTIATPSKANNPKNKQNCGVDSLLLFLSPASAFTRIAILVALAAAIRVIFVADKSQIGAYSVFFKPTLLLGEPQTFESLYDQALETARRKGHEKRFRRAEQAAVSFASGKLSGQVGLTVRLKQRFFSALVHRGFRRALGGQIRWGICGPTPLSLNLQLFLQGAGLPVLGAYGLTETTGPVCLSLPADNRMASAGAPLPGYAVRIRPSVDSSPVGGKPAGKIPEGEIWLRGPGVFSGYLHDAESSDQALQRGWLRTGDRGYVERGQLRITGSPKH